jgi:hypothetical protein
MLVTHTAHKHSGVHCILVCVPALCYGVDVRLHLCILHLCMPSWIFTHTEAVRAVLIASAFLILQVDRFGQHLSQQEAACLVLKLHACSFGVCWLYACLHATRLLGYVVCVLQGAAVNS